MYLILLEIMLLCSGVTSRYSMHSFIFFHEIYNTKIYKIESGTEVQNTLIFSC